MSRRGSSPAPAALARQASDGGRRPGVALRGVALAGLMAAATTACATVSSGAFPENAPWRQRPLGVLAVDYRKPLVARSQHTGEAYERGRPGLDIAHRRVFVGSSDGGLYALNASDGATLWRFQSAGPVQCEPLYDPVEDVVYFGSNDGALYKVQALTGQLVWRFATNAEVARRPVLVGERLFFVNANDTVLALDRAGALLWSQHRSPALGMEVAGHAGLLVRSGLVYAAFSDGTVTAYDAATGKERWQPVDLAAESEQILGEAPTYLDTDTTPVAAQVQGKSAVIVGAYDGGVVALDAETGNQLWSNPGVLGVTDLTLWSQAAHASPADLAGNEPDLLYPEMTLVLASTGTTGLWGLDAETGAELWRQSLPDGGTQRPVAINGALLVATSAQGLFLLSPRDGSVIDGVQSDIGFAMPPAAYGDRAFILSNSGTFFALSVPKPYSPPRP